MPIDVAAALKSGGFTALVKFDTGPEIFLDFKPGEYSKQITITYEGFPVKKYLTMVPADKGPLNMQAVITDEPMKPTVAATVVKETVAVLTESAPTIPVETLVVTETPAEAVPTPPVSGKSGKK